MIKVGHVDFIGAGPGDPGLLTVKGLKALKEADVVVYDRLAHPTLLAETRPDATRIYCGKQPCKHTLRQEDIQTMLLIEARKGKKVVRLKGGDPAVFGRVGEEAHLLKDHGISYTIIPGVTAGIAGAMYAGVPITHREKSRSFSIVTGHQKDKEGRPVVNWKALAEGVDTIVFYMGVKNLNYIAEQLIAHGKKRETPVLVAEWATLSRQREVTGTLATIGTVCEEAHIENPAVIMVGDVVGLKEDIQWFQPEAEKKQLVLKNPSTPKELSDRELTVEKKFLSVEPKQWEKAFATHERYLFLSTTAAAHFFHTLERLNKDIRQVQGDFYAADETVQRYLKERGLSVTIQQPSLRRGGELLLGSALEIKHAVQPGQVLPNHLVTHEYLVEAQQLEGIKQMMVDGHVTSLLLEDIQAVEAVEWQTAKGEWPLELNLFALNEKVEAFALEAGLPLSPLQPAAGLVSKGG
ncbi:uroporphyrinogen-III C-methyltransferase [Salsuginibacillus kocurii]|uniref:uroporphyrinogen-III C-methyltransferase n=1 Tax=Salsuginibacillus kocurii TaxID=427078 RepID=UPI00037877B4|nr:uroporphyrinogen-III C-methyltransferase [Salsuginibacillus kocurii]